MAKKPLTSYQKYLKTHVWKEKRKLAFATYGRRCSQCGATKKLHVHHLTYTHIMNEKIEDLTILCATCHANVHDITPGTKKIRRTVRKTRKRRKPVPKKKR